MRVADTTRLNHRATVIRDIESHILGRVAGKSVLTVGAAGGVDQYLPDRADLWMYARLSHVAREVIGIDIDAQAMAHAESHGYVIHKANCEDMDLGQRFDLILMSDVIEHVECPPQAIRNLVEHLNPGGELLITTPNATYIGNVIRAALRRPASVYWDHMAIYMPEHIQALCDRHGLHLAEVAFFTFVDRRSFKFRIKSWAIRGLTALSPRFHSTFLAVIKAR